MTPDEFYEQMKEISAISCPEEAHIAADSAICDLLESLGYGKAVEVFDKMDKWYA